MSVTTANRIIAHDAGRRFHLWMAGVFALIAFGGFVPTYWSPVAAGRFHAAPVVHVHGVLLFSWCLLYLAQTAWIASGRTPTHRAWGTAGIALFTAMVCSILVTKVVNMRIDDARGFGDDGRRFAALAFCSVIMLTALFAAAIANVRKPEVHKRLMYSLMCGLMIPVFARVFATLLAPPGADLGAPPPTFVVLGPAFVASILIGIGWAHDWRTIGRPHKASVYGGLAVVLVTCLIVPFSYTQTWMRVARSLQALGGS